MSETRTCPQCGAELRDGALEGLCPDCLGKLALGAPEAGGSSAEGRVAGEVPQPAAIQHPGSSIEHPAARFGDYDLRGEIARGGMGVVFKARHVPLNRIVAVKMIRADRLAREEDIRRFRTEAQAAAQLQHPNIVAIHEVGEVRGQHFYAMDYVAGQSLSQAASEKPLSPRQAAVYVRKIAEAIHYAHQRGILHRDLKPSNVLIDENNEPQVTDFGLAKLMAGDSEMTMSGTVMGSPSYMPPEQASGRSREVTVRSDVYSIGAILYDVLCGRPPFRAETTLETLRQVQEMEPVLPRVLNPRAPRDLETIVLKCLQKQPAKRYATAQELADELDRFLRGEPIHARPVNAAEKAWRWCKRKPALAAALGLVSLITIGSPLAAFRINRARQAEQRERQRAQATVTRLEIDRAEMLFDTGQPSEALAYLARVLRREPTNRVAGERIISALAHRNFCVPLFRLDHKTNVTSAEFSPDGQRVLTASKDGTARVWDGRTGQPLLGPIQHAGEVTAAHFSPDGARVITVSLDKTARIWDAQSGQALTEPLQHEEGVLCADFSPDGQRVVTGSADGSLRSWHVATGAPLSTRATLEGGVNFVKFSPAGEWIVLVSSEGSGRILNAADGTEVAAFAQSGSDSGLTSPSFSPDGTRVVTTPTGGILDIIWIGSASTKRVTRTIHNSPITCARLSSDGQTLVTSSMDSTAGIWDADTIRPIGEVIRHENWVNSIEFSPDGQ